MAIKWSIQGGLIYATMLLYALSLAVWFWRGRAGLALYAGGFVLAAASVAYRTVHAAHAPLQNLFEVFLVLGALVFPLSMFSRYALRVGHEAIDVALGLVVLVPAGLVFSAETQHLPPALQSPLFVPHVLVYVLAYVILTKAALIALVLLIRGDRSPAEGSLRREAAVHRTILLGFPLLTGGLVLGAVWGKLAWGDYWNWDPKELWSLATWLVYVGYLHFRSMHAARYPRVNAAIAVLGAAFIVITLLWVNLARIFSGMHSYA